MKTKLLAIAIFLGVCAFCTQAFALDQMIFYRSYAGDQTYAINQGYINHYLLTANTNKEIAIPTGARIAIFSADDDIWVNIGGVAAVPAGDVINGTGSELNPSIRDLGSDTIIGVISEKAAKLSITFYK